jgi:septal ring factor EnvC (AmiA/AmiB activator)
MKSKVLTIVLLLVCVALAIFLFLTHKKSQEALQVAEKQRMDLSNNWARASTQLNEQQKVNITLETNIVQRTEEVMTFSNQLTQVGAKLAKTEAEAKAAAQTAQEELAKRDVKINELQTQRDDLTKRMEELNVSITSLEAQIGTTEKKLTAAEGDRAFLLKELKRLQAEKAELERQFNNLAFLREQVRKLRDEMSIARRLEWLRRGLYGSTVKGGEKLQNGFSTPAAKTNFNLNVELRQDGTVKVAPASTNAPAATTNAPTK